MAIIKEQDMLKLEVGTPFNEIKMNKLYEFETSGIISDRGIKRIRTLINEDMTRPWVFSVKHYLGGPLWKTDDGKYQGTFPKRVSQYMYKTYNHKIDSHTTRRIGNIAKQEMTDGKIILDFTRRITWSSGDFGDHNSCYWTDFKGSRGAFMKQGIGAMRIYNEDEKGVGRAWFMPLSSGTQFLLFQAYGPMHLRNMANVLSQILGPLYKYKEVRVKQNYNEYPMWLNGMGYVVHNKAISNTLKLPTLSTLLPDGGQREWIKLNLPKSGELWFGKE